MRLLLVEDDDAQRRTIRKLLGRVGYDVADCDNVKEAVRLLEQDSFPICVLDLRLEGRYGLDVLRQLDENQIEETSFIIHTGHGTFDSARDALNLGAFAYIEKLGNPNELLNHVHRAAAEHLRKSLGRAEEEIRLQVRLLDCVQQAVIATDLQGNVIYWNQFAESMYGWTAAEACRRNIMDLVVAPAQQEEAEEIVQRLTRGEAWHGEFTVQHRDGHAFPIQVTNSPIHDADNKLIGIIGVSSDITERKQAEQALRESELRYRSVVEASGEAIVSLDRDYVVQTWNRAAEQMFGYTADEIVGESFSCLLPSGRETDADNLLPQIWAGRSIVDFETERLHKDGRLIDVVLNVQPIRDHAGNVTGASGTIRDVTDYKRARMKLRQRDAELAHLCRTATMGEMAKVLAHEVNQPLTAIANYAGVCSEDLVNNRISNDELREALTRIDQQAKHAGKIVNRLKRFISEAEPELSQVDLNQLVHEVCRLMENQIELRLSALELRLDESSPPLCVDALQIEQVLVNLVQNGLEAMEEVEADERCITIATEASSDQVRIRVSDCGRGFTEEIADKMFEPYFTTKPGGLGIGLKICRRIVRAHGGKLSATSNPQGGATFELALPILESSGE